jgi:hypothetical protein
MMPTVLADPKKLSVIISAKTTRRMAIIPFDSVGSNVDSDRETAFRDDFFFAIQRIVFVEENNMAVL